MTDSQSNSLDMFIAVNKLYLLNQAILNGVPARKLGFQQLGTNITAINLNVGGQSSSTKGVTKDKSALRNDLDLIAFAILAPARAWAISVNNNTLAEQFHIGQYQLTQIKDDTIGAYCTMRLGLVSDNLAAMADHGITQALVDTWGTAITDYDAVITDPRQAIITRKQKTKNLKQLFAQTAKLFKDTLDPLMIPLKLTHPELYDLYLSARIVIDRKGSKKDGGDPKPLAKGVIVNFMVQNSVDKKPIDKAKLDIAILDTAEEYSGTTEAKGIFQLTIKELPLEGKNTLKAKATHPEFEPNSVSIEVEKGNVYSVTVSLTPITPPPPAP